MRFTVIHKPVPAKTVDAALDLVADFIADQLIAECRAEVASSRGVSEASIDREARRAIEDARRLSILPPPEPNGDEQPCK